MNVKQKRFCDEYLLDCNITRAAVRAGYSGKRPYSTGRKILDRQDAKKYVEGQLEKLHNERTADAKEVLEYLTSVMRGEFKEQRLKLAGDGIQKVANIDVPAKDRIRAAELIGKRYGMFRDRSDFDGTLPIVIFGEDRITD